MKKAITQLLAMPLAVLFFLIGLLFDPASLLASCYSFAQSPYATVSCIHVTVGPADSREVANKPYFNGSGFTSPPNSILHEGESYYQCSSSTVIYYMRSDNGTTWTTVSQLYSGTTAMWDKSLGFNGYPVTPLPPPPPDCGDCTTEWNDLLAECGSPELIAEWDPLTCNGNCEEKNCNDEWDALVAQCGGEDKVASWVNGPTNDPPICTGSCMCPGQDANTAASACENSGGWVLDWNSYEDDLCQPICNDCRDEWTSGLTSCPNGRWYWDNESCSEICKDCDTAQADCAASCENSGSTVSYFSCDFQLGIIGSCVCADDGDGGEDPEPEPEPEPDPGDDPSDPDDDPADDPVDDPEDPVEPDPKPDPEEPEPDPVEDPDDGANGWLKSIKGNTDKLVEQGNNIVDSTHDTATNTARSVDKLNDIDKNLDNVAENTYATAGNTAKILDELGDIESAIENFDFEDIRTTGNAGQPGAVQYNTELAPVEESSLIDSVSTYISNGLPIISYLNGSYVDITGASPVMSANVWGYQIDFDISPMQDILDAMGIILVGVCSIVAFFIVIGRW